MRVTVFDIETTDLGANFGRLLACSFIDHPFDGKVETYRRDYKKWAGKKLTDDSKLAVAIRDRLEAADIIVGWNSIMFDVPFINARLMHAGERPLRVGKTNATHHLDIMYYAGGQHMRIGSRRLDVVTKFFNVPNLKTPLTAEVWAEASVGDKAAMNDVVEHCEADVRATSDVLHKLAPHVKKIQFTLSEVWPFIGEIPSRK